jgi:transcriptional regulator with XRE-family HTH domain
MTEDDPDRRHFAELLKAFREARGLSRADLGALAGYSASIIKSFETGQRAVYAYHARHLDEAFGLDGIFEHEASRFGKAGYSAAFGAFFDVMQEAEDLYWLEHSHVPGLFQTERYARSILSVRAGSRGSGVQIVCHALDLSQPPNALLANLSDLARGVASPRSLLRGY